MAAPILQLGCIIQCPHKGIATVNPINTRVTAGGAYLLLATDSYTIAGCTFILGNSPHPCVTIEWQAPAQRVKVNGQPVLLETSLGICKAADQVPQGPAQVSGVQKRVKGM
jgi:hypothetical protein